MQNWKDLYLELSSVIKTKIIEVKWIDLWYNQINFLETEHPFPSPAIFMNFRILNTSDLGEKVQNVKLQVDFYIFYETFADTYEGSHNQESALLFLDILNSVNATFHATSGENYSNMRRTGMSPVDTGNAGNTYVVNFECGLVDYSAMKEYEDGSLPEEVSIETDVPEVTFTADNEFRL
jgi:hypothetical protein